MPADPARSARVLVLLGAGRRGGLGRHLFEFIQKELDAVGVSWRRQDLLSDGFDPVLRLADDEPHARACQPAEDPLAARYQEDARWADVLVIVHPVWWFAPPAILKGWVDRILVDGVALEQRPGSPPRGLFSGKRLLVVQTFNSGRAIDRLAFLGISAFFWKRVVGASIGIEKVARLALYGVEKLEAARLRRFEERLRRSLAALTSSAGEA